jgi:hypothetical protein
MDHILQRVVGAHKISFLDGYFDYNWIVVCEEDKEKTTFTTPWGTFMYEKIRFGMMNTGATFKRDMDVSFMGEKHKFMVIYLDDITFSPNKMMSIYTTLRRSSENAKGMGFI